MKRVKLLVLVLVAASSFLIGYAADVKAWPFFGRNPYYGYFFNDYDAYGTDVLPRIYDGGVNALPNYINNAAEFIAFVRDNLYNGTIRERRGAAFMIDTMIGGNHGYPPTPAEVADWESRVLFAQDRGWIGWFTSFSYSINSYYQGTGSGTNPADDAFFSDPDTGSSITFRRAAGGPWIYGIRRQCANPVGSSNIGPLYDNNWSITGRTTVSDATPFPGQTITFRHYIRNSGPNTTDPTTIFWATFAVLGGPALANAAYGYIGSGVEVNVNNENYTVPAGAPPGTQICRLVGWDPINDDGARNGRGARICATVTVDYSLHPVANVNQTAAQDGDTVTFTYTVDNTGTTASAPAQCYVRDGGGALVGGLTLTCDPSQVFPALSPPLVVGTENINIAGQPAGTRICRTLYIQPATVSVGNRASTQTCVIIAKAPYVRMLGNDVWAGGGFPTVTPTCNINAKITTVARPLSGSAPPAFAGSGNEYSATALNQITSFGSASKVLVGTGVVGDLGRSMTFANYENTNQTRLGFYGAASHCIDDHMATYASAPGGAPAIPSALSGAWRVAGSMNMSGNMPAGSQKVYFVEGDVTITNNITYPAIYANASQIPSLVVLATGEIRVQPGVTRVDGHFVSRSTFYTCYPKPVPATVSTCNLELNVNGALQANTIDLYRTGGANGVTTAQRQAPAEIFNFSPEIYLRSALSNGNQTLIEVSNIQELPPRF